MGHMGNKRKRDVSDEELVRLYHECHSAHQVSKKTGITSSTIYRILDRLGIERYGLEQYRRNATRFTPEVEEEIRNAYEDGMYYAQLIERFGGTEYSIKQAIKRAGGKLEGVTPPLTESERDTIITMRKDNLSHNKIAKAIGRSPSTIKRFLRSIGDERRAIIGENHPNWKGGRYKDYGGYVRVWVSQTDPMHVMCLHDNTVLEHRLVMARHLGRPLTKSETVHHINGDRTDNRIENLQLRQGRHGKHVVFVCCDCGSHNIKETKL